MRFDLGLALTSALVCLFAAGPAPGQPLPEREVSVTNHARQAINELYASATAVDDWGDDRLGDKTLDPGQTLHVKLGRARGCTFDLQAVYVDASREEAHGVDVCRGHVFAFDGSTATPPPPAAQHEVTLANRSPRPIQQVLISSSDATDWGDDRLSSGSISVGDSATVSFRGDCIADLRVVFDNRSAEERRGIDMCSARRIAIQPGWATADAVPTEMQPGMEMVPLSVVNRTGHAVTGLFLFETGAADRGPDLLAGTALNDRARISIVVARPAGLCKFAAHVVFGGKLPDQDVAGLDVCKAEDVVLPPRG